MLIIIIGLLIGISVSFLSYKLEVPKNTMPSPSYVYQTVEINYGEELDFSGLADEGWSIVGIGYKDDKISVLLRNRAH